MGLIQYTEDLNRIKCQSKKEFMLFLLTVLELGHQSCTFGFRLRLPILALRSSWTGTYTLSLYVSQALRLGLELCHQLSRVSILPTVDLGLLSLCNH